MNAEFGLGLELLQANAEETGLPGDSFDLAVSEYGASIWCDPAKWIPEAARLLRDGGHLVFLRNSTLAVLCSTVAAGRRRRCNGRSAACTGSSGPSRSTRSSSSSGTATGFASSARTDSRSSELVELYARDDAVDHDYYHSNAEWSKKWPCEEIWRARLHRR